ncbi:MAG: PKD domain-containing protein [Rhodoferax sp.]
MFAFRPILTGVLAGLCVAAGAQAQVLGKITASSTAVKVGEPVTITANIDVMNANYCGFVVDFGDGSFKDGVSDANTPVPLVLTKTYDKPGAYHVTLGGRNVQNHPNCGGQERAVDITVTGSAKPAQAAGKAAAPSCAKGWKLAGKPAKNGAFVCAAKPGTALPEAKPQCPGDLSYFDNSKKGQYGCKP